MKATITARMVASLKATGRPYNVRDTKIVGFMLRVSGKGKASYAVWYRLPTGKSAIYTLGKADILSVAQARVLAREALNAAAHGQDPRQEKRAAKGDTLRGFLDGEYREHMAKWRTGHTQVKRIRTGFPGLLDKKLVDITEWQVSKVRGKRLKEVSAGTWNRDLSALKACLSRAREWGMIEVNPIADMKREKEDRQPVTRYLEPDEEQRLLEALDSRQERMRRERDTFNAWRRERGYKEFPDVRAVAYVDYFSPMVLLALHTGARRGELFNLEWRDVDLKQAMLTVRGEITKSGKTRHIPLNAVALFVLQNWRAQTSSDRLIFESPTGGRFDNANTSWRNLMKEAAIDNFRWHDIRHHFASRLVMAGVDLNVVRELLGHSDLKMTMIYAHLSPKNLSDAVSLLVRQTAE